MAKVTTKNFRHKQVLGGRKGKHKIGKVKCAVFHPTEPRIVGFVVKRPDLLLMFKRPDQFLAYDAFEMVDGDMVVPPASDKAWDEAACKRMGIDYAKCIIWENMSLVTTEGKDLGMVGEVEFDAKTGKVSAVSAADGFTAKKILGATMIPASMIKGYKDGQIILAAEAARVEESGGLAAKAGAASAKLQHKASEKKKEAGTKVKQAGKKVEQAVDDGAYKTGEAVGKARKAMNDKVDEMMERPAEEAAAYKVGASLGKLRDKLKGDDEPEPDDVDVEDTDDDDDDGPGIGGMFSAFADEFRKSMNE